MIEKENYYRNHKPAGILKAPEDRPYCYYKCKHHKEIEYIQLWIMLISLILLLILIILITK